MEKSGKTPTKANSGADKMVGRKQGTLTLITLLLTMGGQLEVIGGDSGVRDDRGDAGGKGWSVRWLISWENEVYSYLHWAVSLSTRRAIGDDLR